MDMRKILIASLMVLCGMALPPKAAEMVLTRIPATAAKSEKDLWRRVMAEFYGKYDKAQKCWVSEHGGKRYCMRPHRLHKVSAGKATHYFIATGGHPIEAGYDCHACAGTLGLIVLSDAGKTLGIVARNSGYEDFGGFGTVPAEENFEVHRLGAPGNYAWTIAGGWSGQGITTTAISIHGIAGDQVKNFGRAPRGFSDAGNCDNGINLMTHEKCTDVGFEPTYDVDSGNARFGTILIKGSGVWKGQPFDRSYRISFDETAMTYRIPPDFPEDFLP
jgi:hypothetical protein